MSKYILTEVFKIQINKKTFEFYSYIIFVVLCHKKKLTQTISNMKEKNIFFKGKEHIFKYESLCSMKKLKPAPKNEFVNKNHPTHVSVVWI